MNRKKLFIHVGTHKAGSTTIQNLLNRESEALLEEGICYFGRFFPISRIMRTMEVYDEELVTNFQKEVQERISTYGKNGIHTYVTSNEKFSGHKMLAYSNAPVIAKTLHDVFAPFDFNIKIIIYVRRQDKYLESMYAQKIKSLASFSFQEFLGEIEDLHAYQWDSFIDVFADEFGKENIIVRSFDRKYLPQKSSLIRGFGKIIGSKHLENYTYSTVKNRGYSRDVLEVARIANKHLDRKEKKVLREVFRELDLPKGSNNFFTDKERANLLSFYEESNKKVVQKYFDDDKMDLFSEPDYENLDHDYEGLSIEKVTIIFMKSLLVMHKHLSEKIELNKKMRLPNRIKRKLKKIASKFTSYFQ